MLAEDDYASCKILESFLEPYGRCEVARNGMEALELYNQRVKAGKFFDLICLDIMMPKVDGVRVLQLIRESISQSNPSGHKTVILMVTALGKTQFIEDAIASGCDGYLTKPIIRDELIKLLNEQGLLDG